MIKYLLTATSLKLFSATRGTKRLYRLLSPDDRACIWMIMVHQKPVAEPVPAAVPG